MDKKMYNTYLEKLKKVHDKRFMDTEDYHKRCKESKYLDPNEYDINYNHTLEEYFDKYGDKLKKAKLFVFKKNELWLMKKYDKYWGIKNKSEFFYFEVPNRLIAPFLHLNKTQRRVALIVVSALTLGGIATGLYFGVFNKPDRHNTLTLNLNGLEAEGVGDGCKFAKGERVTINVTKSSDLAKCYLLPMEDQIIYTNLKSNDVIYSATDDKLTLSFIAPDEDVTISMAADTPFCLESDDPTKSIDVYLNYYNACPSETLQVSLDDGESWGDESGASEKNWKYGATHKVNLNPGQKLYIRNTTSKLNNGDSASWCFASSACAASNTSKMKVTGNISSLLNYNSAHDECFSYLLKSLNLNVDDFTIYSNQLALSSFYNTFNGSKINNAPTVQANVIPSSAFKLSLSGATVDGDLDSMFKNATLVGEESYLRMFFGTEIHSMPTILPATNLSKSCYKEMFFNTTITGESTDKKAPDLPATVLKDSCYFSMFKGSNIKYAQRILPALILENNCYTQLFCNCNDLITAPYFVGLENIDNYRPTDFLKIGSQIFQNNGTPKLKLDDEDGGGAYIKMFTYPKPDSGYASDYTPSIFYCSNNNNYGLDSSGRFGKTYYYIPQE